jgi:hypothetical protein
MIWRSLQEAEDLEVRPYSRYGPALLQATGMNSEFELIFKVVGWEEV